MPALALATTNIALDTRTHIELSDVAAEIGELEPDALETCIVLLAGYSVCHRSWLV